LASLDRRIEYLERLSNSSFQELGSLHLIRANVLFHAYNDDSGASIAYVEALNTFPGLIDAWRSYYEFARDTHREGEFENYLMSIAVNEAHSKELPPPVSVVAQALGGDKSELLGAVSSLMDALDKQLTITANVQDLAARFSWAADALAQKAHQESLSPADSGAIYLGLGLILSSCQEFGRAVTMFDRAMPNVPENQQLFCLMKKGEALINVGEFDAAVQVFEQARKSAPSDFNVRHTLARAFARNGQFAQARLEYRTILATFRLDEETRESILKEIESISE
jgi:tetratricopeptide (TPR) repeat protein